MNHMIHNLTPTPEEVYITYDLDFVPDGTATAAAMTEIETVWLDTVGGAYPVFDAKRGTGGRDRRTEYPDEVRGARRNGWVVPEDGALVGTAGHLHPGGLWTDLKLTRDGRTTRLFRSRAEYYEPAGAVSWDVVDDGDAARLARPAAQGRRAEHLGHLRHREGVVVRVDGHHADDVRPGRHRRRPVRDRRRRRGRRSRTGTCPRTTGTAAAA